MNIEALARKLPAICAARLLTDDSPILIRLGHKGYWPADGLDVDSFNAKRDITPKQVEAMTIGSMFGWDAPGANPDNL